MTTKPYLAGLQEMGAVWSNSAAAASRWITQGLVDPDAARVVSGSRYWPLGWVRDTGPQLQRKSPVLDQAALDRIVEEQSPGRWVFAKEELPPIIGSKELTALFGLPAPSVTGFISEGRFGRPDWHVSGSPLWLLDTAVDLLPILRARSEAGRARSRKWEIDREVEAALREGRYDGPGSQILLRGKGAVAAKGGA
ncbi:hypothetical protein [Streptacidiphilus cavernicola]|uniref:Transcriptional regulator, AbiEi antitoxin, Type IV TA system n=1 Tax=Streptacidiphilus cavernicola TaxID=3342716 RepID=A0ABV6VPC4_9ACTN